MTAPARLFATLTSVLLLMASLLTSASARAETLVVYSTVAAKGALELIAPEFERATAHTVKLKFGTAAELKAEIEKGAACDVALLTAAGIDDLIRQTRLSEKSRAIVFKSGVGIASRKDGPVKRVETPEDLKALLLNAKSVALSTQGASGPIVRRAFETLGIAETMAARVVLISDMTAPEAVVRGRAELAFTQVSEILDTPEAQFLGPLPAPLQTYSVFAVAASPASKAGNAVSAFLTALGSAAAQKHMQARGLIPAGQ